MNTARRIPVLLALLAALLVPAAASAADEPLPDADQTRITVPRTIGGVTLGDNFDKAYEAWGGNGKCKEKSNFCRWGGGTYANDGAASLSGDESGKVDYFYIGYYDGLGKGKPRQGVARFRTKEGLGLGKPLADVGETYKSAEPIHKPSNDRIQAWRIEGDNGYMVFGGGKKIEYIFVNAHQED